MRNTRNIGGRQYTACGPQDYVRELGDGRVVRVWRRAGSYATGRGYSKWHWTAAFYGDGADIAEHADVFAENARTASDAVAKLRAAMLQRARTV